MYITKKIKIPAAGRNEDYKFKNTNSSTSSSSSSSSSSIGLPMWLQFVEYNEENESIKFSKHLLSEGEVAAYQEGTFNTNIFDNIPQGSKTNKGLLQVGAGINVTDGVISLDSSAVTPQTLSFSNNTLSISNGNSVDLSSLETDLSGYYNITQTNTLLNGKANTSHTHSISNVTNLQSSLNAKANKNGSSSENFTVKDLFIHGTVNHWLADVITVDDAKLQLNKKSGAASVVSGLDIFDGTNVVSSLNYTIAGNWQFTSGDIYAGGKITAIDADITGTLNLGANNTSVANNIFKLSNLEFTDSNNVIRTKIFGSGGNFSLYDSSGVQGVNLRGGYSTLNSFIKNRLAIGTGWIITAPDNTYMLYVNGNQKNTGDILALGNITAEGDILANGNITAQGEVTAYSSSDKRLKSNITPLTSSLSIIDKLNPVSFNWNKKAVELNDNKNTSSKNYGVIAQEIEKVLPDLVHQTNGFKSVDYIQLIGVLLGAVKELNNKIKKLENK